MISHCHKTKLGELFQGDCREILKQFPDDHFTTVITDPPYELTSGKNSKKGFMGKAWDGSGVAFDVDTWAEVLRVCKPGAMLLAFGGTRTHHRLMVAIEDAGWEIRDVLMFLYGSGFPKSYNISNGLDKAAGAEREVVSEVRTKSGGMANVNKVNLNQGFRPNNYNEHGNIFRETLPATDAAKLFDGFGTSLKPAYEPIIVAMKPLEKTPWIIELSPELLTEWEGIEHDCE